MKSHSKTVTQNQYSWGGKMKLHLYTCLCVLFLSLAPSNAQADDPVISRYNGPSFATDKLESCLNAVNSITNTLKSIGHSILGSSCEKSSFGSYSVVVDHSHNWGERVEQKVYEFSSLEDCSASVSLITKSMDNAGLVPVYSYCHKNYNRGDARVDYVRKGKTILSDLDRSPLFETKNDCEDAKQDLTIAFSKNKIEPIYARCIDVSTGTGNKELKSMLKYEYAIELGKGVHILRGKQIAENENCDAGLTQVSKLMLDNELPLLSTFCEMSEGRTYQNLVYISGIYSKLKNYAGSLNADLSSCMINLEQAKEALTKAKRTVIYDYCNAKDKRWMDPSEGFRPSVHYLDPPIVIDPKPNPPQH